MNAAIAVTADLKLNIVIASTIILIPVPEDNKTADIK